MYNSGFMKPQGYSESEYPSGQVTTILQSIQLQNTNDVVKLPMFHINASTMIKLNLQTIVSPPLIFLLPIISSSVEVLLIVSSPVVYKSFIVSSF